MTAAGRADTEEPAPDHGAAAVLRYASAQGRWVIAATVLGSGMAALDATVVGIALPVIGRDLHAGTGALQLVVSGYTLTLAALLLLGGSLGDRYGRRRLFSIGLIWFAVASAGCGLAPTAGTLIAARAVQGVGAALLTPGSLAIIQASFAPDDRAKAIGAWSGLGGVATALGPLVGGYLIAAVSWRAVFYLNLPIAVVVLAVTARHVPESRDPTGTGRLDLPGAALATVGLAGATYGVIAAGSDGWSDPRSLVPLVVGVAAFAGFLLREARTVDPMLPLGVFADRQFSAANAVTFAVYAALGGALFLLPVELEVVAGYSPLAAGSALLPVTAIMLALSARSGALAARIGPRLQMSLGPVLVAAGLGLLTRIGPSGGYATHVLPAVVVFGLGLATTVAPLTATVMAAAPAEHAGIASAVNNAVARTAGLFAVAVLPVVAGITGSVYREPAALDAGFSRAVTYAAVVCAAGGLLAAVAIRNPRTPAAVRATAAPLAAERHCSLDGPPLCAAQHDPAGATARR